MSHHFDPLRKQVKKEFEDAKKLGYSKEMFVASLLSDAQEEIQLGLNDRANAHINAAKIILFEIPWWDGREDQVKPAS